MLGDRLADDGGVDVTDQVDVADAGWQDETQLAVGDLLVTRHDGQHRFGVRLRPSQGQLGGG